MRMKARACDPAVVDLDDSRAGLLREDDGAVRGA
jgi:hypothetical protein